ncbi:hypothetical protein E2C01_099187 [Portunus trituberculatus]|uniref:Uncharacterized protein n=1 Tax=Portunus trituberculatus TaxID=210409 RepID=A0A5B7K9P1_PORTR|nr:hypothetical protein [Portunus trituberculatus]
MCRVCRVQSLAKSLAHTMAGHTLPARMRHQRDQDGGGWRDEAKLQCSTWVVRFGLGEAVS